MFTINDPLYLWIPSQVLAAVSLFFIVWAFSVKDRFLVLQGISFAFYIGALLLLGNWIVAGILTLALIRNISLIFLKSKWWRFGSMIFFSIATVVFAILVAIFTGYWWIDWFLMVWGVFFVIAVWHGGIHPIRVVGFTYAPFIILNHVEYQNFVGIILEVITFVAIVVFYIRLFAKAKAAENLVDGSLGDISAADLTDMGQGKSDIHGGQIQGSVVQV